MSSDLTYKEDRKKQNLNHTIKNQYGNIVTDDTHIEKEYLQKIKDMLHNGLTFIYVDDKKINMDVTRDFRKHDSRETVLFIEGI